MTVTRARGALVALVFGALCAACDDSGPPAIRLFINVEAAVPTEVDEVQVAIAASSQEGRYCKERTGLFHLSSPEDLPLYVRIEQGEIYTRGAMYWISGWKDDEQVLEVFKGGAEWPAEGEVDAEVVLSAECLIANLRAPCAADQHCEPGAAGAGDCRTDDYAFRWLLQNPDDVDPVFCWDQP
jgi:hypothetical protein